MTERGRILFRTGSAWSGRRSAPIVLSLDPPPDRSKLRLLQRPPRALHAQRPCRGGSKLATPTSAVELILERVLDFPSRARGYVDRVVSMSHVPQLRRNPGQRR